MSTSVQVGNLGVVAVASPKALLLEFAGQADSLDSQELFQYLLHTHCEAIQQRTAEIKVDFTNVGFMNSSSLNAFIGWLGELQKVEPLKRYRILFEGSTSKQWQQVSLKALARLAPEQINLSFI